MRILGIETSCDETSLSLIDAKVQINADKTQIGADKGNVSLTVLADKTRSQIELHKHYGGVFPTLAKREHSRNLIPLLKTVLEEANFGNTKSPSQQHSDILQNVGMLLEREQELLKQFLEFIPTIEKPPIDVIAVTEGPGLEPCLWTGINFAKALSLVWDIPVVPVNHMEGHIVSALMQRAETADIRRPHADSRRKKVRNLDLSTYKLANLQTPALALLISGGHTELVLIKDYFDYRIIGATRDDAVGEAFDKVARLLGLPYPGGPEISRLAERARQTEQGLALYPRLSLVKLPRPMLHSNDFDFSFSGLKTAVLYLLKKIGAPDEKTKAVIAREFEDAVSEVLIAKTGKAIEQYGAQALLIGGGVIANIHIRAEFEKLSQEMGAPLFIPEPNLTTDNALMIAAAGFLRLSLKNGSTKPQKEKIEAKGNLRLDKN